MISYIIARTIMKPTLGYIFLARDIIQDSIGGEMSAIRLFDTLYILKNQNVLAYSINVLGRLYLNTTGIVPDIQIKLRMIDPTGNEISARSLTGRNINGEIGMNIIAKFWPVVVIKA